MKKLLLLATFLLFFTNVKSQSYTYHSFPDSSGIWSYTCFDWMGQYTNTYLNYYNLVNDTMTNGYSSYYESGKQIFLKSPFDSTYRIVYDFNLTVGDTFINPDINNAPWDSILIVQRDDTLSQRAAWPNRRIIEFDNGAVWIEGVGNIESWAGWEHSTNTGTLSGGCRISCISNNGSSYPCSNFSQAENTLSRVSIYPNPSTGIFNLKSGLNQLHLEVFSTTGVLVFKTENPQTNRLDLSHLKQGPYILSISDGIEQRVIKIVLE